MKPLPLYPDPERPRTRGDCADGPRPCPWISCRFHLAWDVRHKRADIPGGGPRLLRPTMTDDEIVEALAGLADSCTLDVAARGGEDLLTVAEILGLSVDRTRQLEIKGLLRLRARLAARDVREDDLDDLG